jgi:hypothetical protein
MTYWYELAARWTFSCRICKGVKLHQGTSREACGNEDCERFGMTVIGLSPIYEKLKEEYENAQPSATR